MPDLRKAFREGPQPERPHVYGAPTDSGGGSERQQSAAAATAVQPAYYHSDWRGGSTRPGQVTAGSPGLLYGYINYGTSSSSPPIQVMDLGRDLHYGSTGQHESAFLS